MVHRHRGNSGVLPRRLLGLLVGLGCAVLVLASPAAALPKLPSPITIPTLPKLPAVPTLPGIGGLPIVSQPIDIPLPVPPLPVDVPLPVDLPLPPLPVPPLPVAPLPVVPSARLSTSAFPGLDGLPAPVPLSADGLTAAAAADGEQLAPDGASAGSPAEGFPETPTSGLLRQPGTGANPQGTRSLPRDERERRLRVRVPQRARQPAPSVTKRAAQTTERVEVAGISLARTGVAVLGLVAVGGLLLVVGVSVLRLRRRLGATRAG